MKKISPPTYTQVPNTLLDGLADLTECEMAVALVICRETFGWHRSKARLTVPEIVARTGRSHGGVSSAIASLCKAGIVEKTSDPSGNIYALKVVQPSDEVVQPPDGGSPTTGRPPVQPPDGPIKERKDLKKEDIPAAAAADGFHKSFVARWCLEYPKAHGGAPYVFVGGKDGSAVKRLSASGLTLDHLFRIAISAWEHPYLFNCKQAASIAGFASRINDIRAELNNTKKKPTEGNNRKEGLSSPTL